MADFDDDFWNQTSQKNPYWGVLTHDKYLGTELEESLKSEFYQTGQRDINFAVQEIKRHILLEFRPKKALDFGCGVGRLLLAMASHADHVSGVDLAPDMLECSRRALVEGGIEGFSLSTDIPQESFDWINSYIVLQHIPPRKGIVLIEQLLSRLSVGGVISLHVSIFRDERCLLKGLKESNLGRFNGEEYVNYNRGALTEMSVYEYDLSHVMALMVQAGMSQFHMWHTDHGGLHGVWIFARKIR